MTHIFYIRTPRGDAALENKELITLSYYADMVLRLCDGRFSSSLLETSIKEKLNVNEIIQLLLDNRMITICLDPVDVKYF